MTEMHTAAEAQALMEAGHPMCRVRWADAADHVRVMVVRGEKMIALPFEPNKHLIAMGDDWVHWPHAGERGTIQHAVVGVDEAEAADFDFDDPADPAGALGDSDAGNPQSAPTTNAPKTGKSAGNAKR